MTITGIFDRERKRVFMVSTNATRVASELKAYTSLNPERYEKIRISEAEYSALAATVGGKLIVLTKDSNPYVTADCRLGKAQAQKLETLGLIAPEKYLSGWRITADGVSIVEIIQEEQREITPQD